MHFRERKKGGGHFGSFVSAEQRQRERVVYHGANPSERERKNTDRYNKALTFRLKSTVEYNVYLARITYFHRESVKYVFTPVKKVI